MTNKAHLDWKPAEHRVRKGRVVGGPWDGRLVAHDSPWLKVPVVQDLPPVTWEQGAADPPEPYFDMFTYVFVDEDSTWRLQ